MIAVVITTSIHIMASYYFVVVLLLSVKGAALATTFTYTLSLITLTIVTSF